MCVYPTLHYYTFYILVNIDPAFGFWHCLEVACVVNVAEEHTALMMEAVCSFETATTQPTITQCQHLKAES
jgi:hypothetical protein